MKMCKACETELPLEAFSRHSKSKDGRQGLCKPCDRRRSRDYYARNKARMMPQIHQAAAIRAAKVKRFVCEFLAAHPCVDCGEVDIRVLEFDHHDGGKLANVSNLLSRRSSLELVQAEMAKCEVVCANCHKIRTDTRADNYRVRFLEGRL